jgi:alkanesulfonate monooxygenase SsuD/methylene tetrahydromethanopterin reductase-like flavin-dependent oxidoreductase (luciferase family)
MYQEEFAEELRLPDPRTAVAVWALCADTDEEARRLSTSSRMTFTLLRQGRLIPVPPPETAERFLASQGDGLGQRRRTIVGAPDTVRAGIEAAAGEYGAEEVIVVTITYDHAARRRSYELIAEAFGLSPVPLAAAADD